MRGGERSVMEKRMPLLLVPGGGGVEGQLGRVESGWVGVWADRGQKG